MSGSNKGGEMRQAEVLAAVRAIAPGADYVWDGVSEDDRPATPAELATARRKPGRPAAEVARPTLNMRVDPEVLAWLRESGKGWQTRVNAMLRVEMEREKARAGGAMARNGM